MDEIAASATYASVNEARRRSNKGTNITYEDVDHEDKIVAPVANTSVKTTRSNKDYVNMHNENEDSKDEAASGVTYAIVDKLRRHNDTALTNNGVDDDEDCNPIVYAVVDKTNKKNKMNENSGVYSSIATSQASTSHETEGTYNSLSNNNR